MKRCLQQHLNRVCRTFAAMAVALGLLAAQSAFALPTGWQVVEGNVSFDQQGSVLNVISQSDKAVVSYITFNLASGETINFILPNATSSILNKVIGGQVSNIAGMINSNGRIGLVNTSGIHLASTAQVQSAALLATTLNIADQDFFNDTMTLVKNGNGATVINEGKIDISKGGYALIAANNIINSGSIIAEDGSIHLAVGDKVTFHLSNNSSVEVLINEGIKALVDDLNVAIGNNGYLKAHTVELKAKLADGVIANTINNDGIIQGTAIADVGGQINILAEGGTNLVDNTGILYVGAWDGNNKAGTIRVKGNYNHNSGMMLAIGGEGATGGHVEMLGDNVINEGSYIDVSGGTGGGVALIGGDYQGKGETYTAKHNYADAYTEVYADAITEGDGGKVIFWSDENTYNYSTIVARGGLEKGNGGFAEVSGKEYLDFFGSADLTATDGEKGTLLLDPTNLTIVEWNGATDIADLRLWLDASDVNGTGVDPVNGSNIGTWVDKSGNGFNATEGNVANQPTYQSTGLNGRESLFFNDEATGLQGSITRPTGTASTVFLMGQYNSASGNDKAFFEFRGAGGVPRQFFINRRYAGNNLAYTWAQDTPIGLYIQDPGGTSNYNLYQNGTALATNAGKTEFSTTFTSGTYTLGDDDTGGNRLIGHISELMYFDRALTADEISLMNQHMEAKWGVSQNINLTNVSQLSDKYLEYLSQSSNVSLQADQNITINNMSDNLISLGNRSLTLTATNGNITFLDTNDVIRTEGTDIIMTAGGSMTLGGLNTRGASGTLLGGDVSLTTTGSGNVSVASGNIGGTLTVDMEAGGNLTLNNTAVSNVVDIDVNGGNGTITATGVTFGNTARIDTNDRTGGNISLDGQFVGALDVYGDDVDVNQTTGNLTFSSFVNGDGGTSTITATAAGASIDVTFPSPTGNDTIFTADQNITSSGINTAGDRFAFNSNSGGNITLSGLNLTGGMDVVGRTTAQTPTAGSLRIGTNGGNISILNSTIDGFVDIDTNNANIVLGNAANAVTINGTTGFSAGTGDVTGYGAFGGAVSGTAGRVGISATSGNFTSGGLTASNATGWAGDESLIIQTTNGDILGAGYTTSGAANIRLQAGTTGSVLATNNINVTNVSSGQNLSLWATGDTAGTGNGTAIQVGGTSSVAGYIQAAGFNAANNITGANGAINIALSSGNLITGLAWADNDNITLTASNGSILQSSSGFPWAFNGKTIFTSGGDVALTASGGAGSYISTGVNALGSGSDLTATASGQNAGLSVQLFGRVDGNLTTHHTSGSGTALTGGVNLGTGLGGSVANLNDTYTVQDVLGTTFVRASGAVNMYGSFWGPVTVLNSSSITAAVDKGPLNIATASASGNISLTSYRDAITGTTISSTGGGGITLQAGSQWTRDKLSHVSISNLTTTGALNVTVAGSTNGSTSGNSIVIGGSTGSSSGSHLVNDVYLGTVSMP